MQQIRFNVPYTCGHEKTYMDDVMARGFFGGNGPFTKRCHQHLEGFTGCRVLLTTSCTAALELAAMALDCGPDDEIIVPSFTFVSTASAFLRTGASIVFGEVNPATLMLDVADVERRITTRTKAVVAVHYGGVEFDIRGLTSVCQTHGLALVEDAAQAFGSAVSGRQLGTMGRMGTISFHETKNIHCGLGGALYLSDTDFDRVENIWERGTNRTKMLRGLVDKYSWVEPGSSFYPTELQAAFLLAQLEHLQANLDARAKLTAVYDSRLVELEREGLLSVQVRAAELEWNHHAMICIFPTFEVTEHVRRSLKAQEIHAYIGYVPLHSSPMGRRLGWSPNDLPITEDVARRVLRMPLHHAMSEADVHRVCDAVADALSDAEV